MQLSELFALVSGPAPLDTGSSGALTVHELGVVRVPSGVLGAADPFVSLDRPITVQVAPGEYPVVVTIADVSPAQDGSHLREAYLSVILSDRPVASVEPVPGPDGPPEEGSFYGVPVDAGTVAFFDAAAVESSMPGEDGGDNWYDDVFDTGEPGSWFDILDADTPLRAGAANIEMPLATRGENVVLVHSGWGDGFYPVIQTLDAQGGLVAVHIDLQVVGPVPDPAPDPAPASPSNPTPTGAGWLARLRDRLTR